MWPELKINYVKSQIFLLGKVNMKAVIVGKKNLGM